MPDNWVLTFSIKYKHSPKEVSQGLPVSSPTERMNGRKGRTLIKTWQEINTGRTYRACGLEDTITLLLFDLEGNCTLRPCVCHAWVSTFSALGCVCTFDLWGPKGMEDLKQDFGSSRSGLRLGIPDTRPK